MAKQNTREVAKRIAAEPDPVKRNALARAFIESICRKPGDEGPAPEGRDGFIIGAQQHIKP